MSFETIPLSVPVVLFITYDAPCSRKSFHVFKNKNSVNKTEFSAYLFLVIDRILFFIFLKRELRKLCFFFSCRGNSRSLNTFIPWEKRKFWAASLNSEDIKRAKGRVPWRHLWGRNNKNELWETGKSKGKLSDADLNIFKPTSPWRSLSLSPYLSFFLLQ